MSYIDLAPRLCIPRYYGAMPQPVNYAALHSFPLELEINNMNEKILIWEGSGLSPWELEGLRDYAGFNYFNYAEAYQTELRNSHKVDPCYYHYSRVRWTVGLDHKNWNCPDVRVGNGVGVGNSQSWLDDWSRSHDRIWQTLKTIGFFNLVKLSWTLAEVSIQIEAKTG